MKLSKAQRRKIYLEAAKLLRPDETLQFCCHIISSITGEYYLHITSENYPELYEFRTWFIHNNWISPQLRREGITDRIKINEAKQTVLLLCAEMTLTENL